MNFGERVLNLLKEKNVTQKKFCEDLNIGKNQLYYWAANNAAPKIDTVNKIADYFQVTTNYLFGIADNPTEITDNPELNELIETLKNRPEMQMLISLTKHATADDIKKAVMIIEALQNK
jgi:transcriptional regulator with XRE-family HTH domain